MDGWMDGLGNGNKGMDEDYEGGKEGDE